MIKIFHFNEIMLPPCRKRRNFSLPSHIVWDAHRKLFLRLTWNDTNNPGKCEKYFNEVCTPCPSAHLYSFLSSHGRKSKKMRNNRRAIRNGGNRFCFIIIVIFYLFSLSCSSASLDSAPSSRMLYGERAPMKAKCAIKIKYIWCSFPNNINSPWRRLFGWIILTVYSYSLQIVPSHSNIYIGFILHVLIDMRASDYFS